jgi:hypothetical protein
VFACVFCTAIDVMGNFRPRLHSHSNVTTEVRLPPSTRNDLRSRTRACITHPKRGNARRPFITETRNEVLARTGHGIKIANSHCVVFKILSTGGQGNPLLQLVSFVSVYPVQPLGLGPYTAMGKKKVKGNEVSVRESTVPTSCVPFPPFTSPPCGRVAAPLFVS